MIKIDLTGGDHKNLPLNYKQDNPMNQATSLTPDQFEKERIQPYPANPSYWQYRGKPVLLLGGSVEDNLYQIPNLKEHLDLLHSVGGNYIRCTMSARDPGDVWPFGRAAEGQPYDLNRWNDEYWLRFENCLLWCYEREIILQIELWDRFDFTRAPWQANPFNPKNNINYTASESGLKEEILTHAGQRESAFFRSIPASENNALVLKYQQAFVDKMLSYSLGYPNVLYCMDNETNEPPEWGAYWAGYIKRSAAERGVKVETTEMWDAHSVLDPMHEATWKHPELYTFCDISQNNHRPPDQHWNNAQEFRKRILESGTPRPINSVKVYGANTYQYGTTRDAIERFWRNIFGGLAAVRFHRPPTGLGLGEKAQRCVQSARMLTDAMQTLFTCEPRIDLLSNRSYNEAYSLAGPRGHTPVREYAVFFTDGGDVRLAVEAERPYQVRWLEILSSEWRSEETLDAQAGQIRLETPVDSGYWAALIRPARGG